MESKVVGDLRHRDHTISSRVQARRPTGFRCLVYGFGRILQGFGLLLLWWVLLLFAGVADMGTLLYWSLAAALLFYLGWVGTVWAKKDN